MRALTLFTVFAFVFLMSMQSGAEQQTTVNINVAMMESTCKIVGKGSIGTGFIIGKPSSKDPKIHFYTLVTAHHVLAAVQDENVILVFRQLTEAGKWERTEIPLHIRDGAKELWRKHNEVDLAVMHVRLPKKVIRSLVPMSLIFADEKIKEYEIGPGDELFCLGYPFGEEANPDGFAILRSGKVASYPLLPTKKTKTFLFSFTIFPGNSGGPVYLYEKQPIYEGKTHLGCIQGIMGVVTTERRLSQRVVQLYETREVVTPLALAEVIHASFIEELIKSLPEPEVDLSECK